MSARFCNSQKKPSEFKNDYPITVENGIPPGFRNTPTEALPPPARNGGLFSGPEPPRGSGYEAIPVPASGIYYIAENLKSANPPPGATTHFCGTDRSSNNYFPMTNINWLNDPNARYPADNRYFILYSKDSNER